MNEINTGQKKSFINEKEKIAELEKNKEFEKIKQDLDKGCNFIDYFLVIGLEPEIYQNKWLYEADFDSINKKYKEKIKPKIISSFPPFEKTTISFDESIINHCFPNGYSLVKSFYQPKPKVFSFILDNNFFNINYPQKYLSCLLCYESVKNYKRLYDKEHSNKNNNSKEQAQAEFGYEIYIPKCLLLMSLYPFFGEFEKIITEIYNYSQNIVMKTKEINNIAKKRLSLKKASTLSTISFENKYKNKDVNDPIEKMIENLLIELPVPPRGVSKVTYFLNEEERTIKQNEMNKLPLIDVNLKRICIDFEAKDIITIYNYLFLESRILFFSKNIEYLNSYIYGFLSLLYPFQYQYQVITILPNENFEILESITPFIAGINQPFEDFFTNNDFTLSDCILIVDIDNKKHFLHNEEEDNKLPEFPKNNKKILEKKLQDIINKYLKEAKYMIANSKKKYSRNATMTVGPKNFPTPSFSISSNDTTIDSKTNPTQGIQVPDESILEDENEDNEEIKGLLSNLNIDYAFNQEINESFFNFNANLLSNYNSFLNRKFYSHETPSLETLFKVQDFLKKVPSNDKNFYDKFVSETQIFGDFIYLRMIPKNTKEKIRILLFDEKINENSKNSSKVFTETKEYDFVDTHSPQKPRSLTKEESDFYKDPKNQKELLKYGIIVSTDKKDNNKVVFKYPIFPKLTNLLFLSENIKVYFPPENWNDNFDQINEDLISKSHLGDVSIRLDDMKKYIYLCWMQMWALTFWYSKENEKKYWFQELLRIIEISSCYEMEIFNLLFEALSNYGKENMVLRLYSILLKKRLNPSFKVHNIVMKILEKKKESGNFGDILQKIIEKDEKSSAKQLIKNNFSKRTFRSRYYPNILSENINFYAFDTCMFCQKDINLELISKNLKEMNRDLNWTNCPECHEQILPKLTVQFGEEINKNGDFKTNTCKFDTVVLFSPYVLKNNYNSYFPRNIGVKLDVDELMMKYSSIFWNSLWYFKLNGLEYDFMQPYYYRLETVKPYKDLKVTLIEQGKNDSDDEDNKQPFEVNKFKIVNNSFTLK